jgi:FMN-dependent oxidoreductase (nitrilotriacetate monooxygenase family)
MSDRKMKLGAFVYGTGHHAASWRHPDSVLNFDVSFPYFAELAGIAERGLFDLLFWADSPGLPQHTPDILSRTAYIMRMDPVLLLAALGAVTKHVGLVSTATTTYDEPFHIARRFATIDHISGGRSGWNLVTTGIGDAAQNFSYVEHPSADIRYKRAREFAEVVLGLWDSFDADAFIRDAESGIFFDPEKIHQLDFKGEFFQVRGPLNVARSPQGRPIMVQAGSSEDGRELAAQYADVVFTAHNNIDSAKAFYADVKGRMAAYGRDTDHMKIMPGIFAMVGRTEKEAREKYDTLQELIDPKIGLLMLQQNLKFDFSGYPLDGPLPELPDSVMSASRPALFVNKARAENLTIRQVYMSIAGGRGHHQVFGTASQIADVLEEWFHDGAADGFNMMAPIMRSGLADFSDLLVPELQRRGLFRTAYEGTTLRENLGLPMPKSRYETAPVL